MWRFCLTWGVPFDTFMDLAPMEAAALMEAARQIQRERRKEQRKGR